MEYVRRSGGCVFVHCVYRLDKMNRHNCRFDFWAKSDTHGTVDRKLRAARKRGDHPPHFTCVMQERK